jgi:hypothetical protein
LSMSLHPTPAHLRQVQAQISKPSRSVHKRFVVGGGRAAPVPLRSPDHAGGTLNLIMRGMRPGPPAELGCEEV